MYLNEYEELTSKLNEFQTQESQLLEEMAVGANSGSDLDSPLESTSEASINNNNYHNNNNIQHTPSQGSLVNYFNTAGQATYPVPKSPLKSVVRAYLPNQQRTTMQVHPGQTVREALSKAMKRRKLTPEMCVVYRFANRWEGHLVFC